MDRQEEYKDDLLKQYINKEVTEAAPEGFTAKVMTRIHIEAEPVRVSSRLRNKNLIPLVSAAFTLMLILAAFLTTGQESNTLSVTLTGLFKYVKGYLPEFDLSSIFRFNLPALFIYVIAGLLILIIFDKALNVLFHREK